MNFSIAHNNITVLDLEKSLAFYKNALGMDIQKIIEAEDGSFKIVYLTDGSSVHKLELTWYRDKQEPWNLGDNEIHTAFITDDFDAAYAHHSAMGCICYENKSMGIYFIADPDGYWVEILPAK